MQPHEGPRRDREGEERRRQWALTRWLTVAIAVLVALMAAALIWR